MIFSGAMHNRTMKHGVFLGSLITFRKFERFCNWKSILSVSAFEMQGKLRLLRGSKVNMLADNIYSIGSILVSWIMCMDQVNGKFKSCPPDKLVF